MDAAPKDYPDTALAHLGLAHLIADRTGYGGGVIDRDDRFQYAALGLCKAERAYDRGSGVAFHKFAHSRAREEVQRGFRDECQRIRTAKWVWQHANAYRKEERRLLAAGRGAGFDEVCESLGVAAKVARYLGYWSRVRVVHELRGGMDPEDHVAVDAAGAVDREEAARKVREAVASLPGRERGVVAMRFGLGGPAMTLAEVGKLLGVSNQMAHKIEAKAKKRLCEALRALDPGARV